MARRAVTAHEAQRVRVHELGFAARDGRAFAVGDARVDRERRRLGLAAELDRFLDRQRPRVIEIEVGPASREPRRIGEAGRRVFGGVARDRKRLVDGGSESRRPRNRRCSRCRARWPTYTVTLMPLSRLYEMVSTAPLRTVTLWPMPCETSVSAAVAPPRLAASSTAADMRSSSAVETGKMARMRRCGAAASGREAAVAVMGSMD